MKMDFHAKENEDSYTGRAADATWASTMLSVVDPRDKRVVDIGCGGGIYSKAWAKLGAASVTGVDFSSVMLAAAQKQCADEPRISFVQGDALETGLPDGCADIVFARALIHHLHDLRGFFSEVKRLLATGGICLIQDRTIDDCAVPASQTHLRGYFFEQFPRLLEVEAKRRPADRTVRAAMQQAGLAKIERLSLWEVRRVYGTLDELARDLRSRKGRSLLHELTDAELEQLVDAICLKLSGHETISEQDRWTIWIGK
ncbi:methyltransferase [Brevibacillus agri]|uniref:Methyltransferase n=1 Tax=Brevibacillus agri TaxID=51101 RepID=A0A3M8ARI0_9BACL|nr:class I SAM-dependent methyltransferase [Brevibacillus agri]MDR9503078.1 class I SAM-dependent methyltransferase [Brevibacillus agri]MED1644632.1 class I SAM-dependent methyltransferase [Brevibacillus agri]MED1655589.1 class I SAM-dependent methyltransferase [Brevibacillus agri]MED1689132.1 class I SAM-dependent methyltransferase [Brevibacillus agri]MED1691365.1 class I SAM-dependent methyltransferase [Brevibacillus agri]